MSSTTTQEMPLLSGKYAVNTEDLNINNKLYSDDLHKANKELKELIERKTYNKYMDYVNHDGKHFLAIGLHMITDVFESEKKLFEHIEKNMLEICFTSILIVNAIQSQSNN